MQNSEFWADRNVFVTGATGFLGSWLSRMLVEKGANVSVLVRDMVPKSQFFTSGTANEVVSVKGRLEDQQVIRRALNEYDVEFVFHLGAQTQVVTANRSPVDTYNANILGTWNVLEAARNSGLVKGVVLASTDKAYGSQSKLPYDESTPLQGEHPYDVSKSCADLIAQSYHKTYGVPLAITRCGNFYGGGDLNFNRILPGTIKSAWMKKPPEIRSDGKYVRDYFYIEDAALAYMMLAEQLHKKEVQGEAFNFSNEDPKSVIEITEMVLKLMNSAAALKPKILNEASGEIREQYLSAKKARKVLGWKARYPLQEGLRKTIGWYLEFFRRSKLAKYI